VTLKRRAPDHEEAHAAGVAHRSLATLGL